MAWEMEMHGNNRTEVINCLRLHIGDCELLSKVIRAFENQSSIEDLCPRYKLVFG